MISPIAAFIIAFVVMTLIGFFVIHLLLYSKRFSVRLMWALAPIVGAGICSFIQFLFRRPMFTVEMALLITLASVWLWRHRLHVGNLSALTTYRVSVFAVLLAMALVWVFAESVDHMERMPHGAWDGFAIWNSHARYLFRAGPTWQDHLQNTFHGDYPLFLPSMVARLWRYAGNDVPTLGGLFGILLAFSSVFVVGTVLTELRGALTGVVMALTLSTTPSYMIHGTYQQADVPLSVFILSTIALLYLSFESDQNPRGVLVLAGFMAGCAGWTKNEGLLFILATALVLLSPLFRKPKTTLRRVALFSAGLLLPLAVHIFFKVAIAPQNDLIDGRAYGEIAQKILTVNRHGIIFSAFLRTSWTFGGWGVHAAIPILAFLALAGHHRQALRSFGWRAGVAILAIVLVGYYWVYVLTPADLVWHLESSLSRLMIHLWPSVVLLAGLAARQPHRLQD